MTQRPEPADRKRLLSTHPRKQRRQQVAWGFTEPVRRQEWDAKRKEWVKK